MIVRNKKGQFTKESKPANGFKAGVNLGRGFKKGMKLIGHKAGCSCFRCKKGQVPKSAFVKGQAAHNKGIPITEEQKNKQRNKMLGRKSSLETRMKQSLSLRGSKSPLWKGGDVIGKILRGHVLMTEWRIQVFKRDKYRCSRCLEVGGELHAHHKRKFSIILREFLSTYNQFSPYEDVETLLRIADKYDPFWDINNGETLCLKCHRSLHKTEKFAKLI